MRWFVLPVLLSLGVSTAVMAAPIAGYESLYQAVFDSCTLPNGTVPLCEAAIDAYAAAIVPVVTLAEANASFSQLRQEVLAGNLTNGAFQTLVEDLFEQLLPESGAIGPLASP